MPEAINDDHRVYTWETVVLILGRGTTYTLQLEVETSPGLRPFDLGLSELWCPRTVTQDEEEPPPVDPDDCDDPAEMGTAHGDQPDAPASAGPAEGSGSAN